VARQILEGPHLSVLATTNADRSAQMSVIFVKPDGADIFFSTIEGRRKTTNMLRDPRVTLLLHSLIASATDSAYATIHGTVELTDDPGGAFHQGDVRPSHGRCDATSRARGAPAHRPRPSSTRLRAVPVLLRIEESGLSGCINIVTVKPQPSAGMACPTAPELADLHPLNNEPTIGRQAPIRRLLADSRWEVSGNSLTFGDNNRSMFMAASTGPSAAPDPGNWDLWRTADQVPVL
jgi:hypothetical protein